MAKVLLIEPDKPLAAVYQQALASAGHEVVVRHTAQSAIFAVDDGLPDLVLLELQLAAHSGIEFLYELRTYPEWQNVPVVVLSQIPAYELESSFRLLRDQLGISSYHYKPQVSLSQLLAIVEDSVKV